jgi:hypothetical protein
MNQTKTLSSDRHKRRVDMLYLLSLRGNERFLGRSKRERGCLNAEHARSYVENSEAQ